MSLSQKHRTSSRSLNTKYNEPPFNGSEDVKQTCRYREGGDDVDIKAMFRMLKRYHPDKNSDNKEEYGEITKSLTQVLADLRKTEDGILNCESIERESAMSFAFEGETYTMKTPIQRCVARMGEFDSLKTAKEQFNAFGVPYEIDVFVLRVFETKYGTKCLIIVPRDYTLISENTSSVPELRTVNRIGKGAFIAKVDGRYFDAILVEPVPRRS